MGRVPDVDRPLGLILGKILFLLLVYHGRRGSVSADTVSFVEYGVVAHLNNSGINVDIPNIFIRGGVSQEEAGEIMAI